MNKVRAFLANINIRGIVIVVPLLIFILFFILIMNQKPYVIFPGNSQTTYSTHSDKSGQGNSEINLFKVDDEEMHFSYTLKEGNISAYAGVDFFKHGFPPYVDASGYTYLTLYVQSDSDTNLTCAVNTFRDNYTQPNIFFSYPFFEHLFLTNSEKKVYKLPLKDFLIPAWWFEKNKDIDARAVANDNFSKIYRITLASSDITPFDVRQDIVITKVQFEKGKLRPLTVLAFLFTLYMLIVLLTAFMAKSQPANTKLVYKSLDIRADGEGKSGEPDSFEESILGYIAQNFENMDLTIEVVSKKLNIAANKISRVIKDRYSLSFPAYINAIRITEAKRLLTQTDMKVIDTAMTVGYKSVAHFHRIFKKHTGVSPKKFRQDARL